MKPGDVIEIGDRTNPFFGFYDVQPRTHAVVDQNGVMHQVPAICFLRLVQDGTVNAGNLGGDAYDTARHFLMLASELLWENVRLAEFPDRPSRQRCLFLIESIPDVKQ
jgi:hypothetical protein